MNAQVLATKALAAVTALGMFAPAASAQSAFFQEHQQLWNAIQSVGVEAVINHPHCELEDVAGFYSSQRRLLVVCQDNREGQEEVAWTANDLDTLRHEAQHLIQDCEDGVIADGRLVPLMDNWDQLQELVEESGLTKEEVTTIILSYRELGLADEAIILEVEAFAAAAGVPASTIADAVITICGAR